MLSDYLSEDRILLNSDITDKYELLKALVYLQVDDLELKEKILKDAIEREAMLSTAVGNKIALPHVKSEQIKSVSIAIITLEKPIDFEASSGEPIQIAFMILSNPYEYHTHLKLISEISNKCSDLSDVEKLIKCTEKSDFINLLAE